MSRSYDSSARSWTRRPAEKKRFPREHRDRIRTPLTELTGVEHPIVQTGMGWVAGPRLVTATAEAGGLGILASATMTLAELEQAIVETKGRTEKPFGVNLRADAADAMDRVNLLVKYGVKALPLCWPPSANSLTS
ncbi:nitronate monooxygenase [Pseudarthrobacter sp. H2]|uniref:nitronate monooxygenase n=1 Tax=Pseudarthrobacter sp. H2 TaxID=3418415 RepID=UPI003CF6560B